MILTPCRYCGRDKWSGHSLAAHERRCRALTAHSVEKAVRSYRNKLRYIQRRLLDVVRGEDRIGKGTAKALARSIEKVLSSSPLKP